mgnify:CR=1 FL=1
MKTSFLNFKKTQINLIAGLAILSISAFTGCKEDEVKPVVDPKEANVVVVHASPDAPAVDLLIDNVKINSAGLVYPTNTGYLKVKEGLRNFKINVAGTSTSVINSDVTLVANKNYSVFAINKVASIGAIITEDNLDAPAAGQAKVRFIHLSPDAPAVDVTLTDGTKIFPNQEFKTASGFTGLAANTYNLQVRVAGTASVALSVPGVKLESGKIYTIFAKGLLAGIGEQALGAQIIVNK